MLIFLVLNFFCQIFLIKQNLDISFGRLEEKLIFRG